MGADKASDGVRTDAAADDYGRVRAAIVALTQASATGLDGLAAKPSATDVARAMGVSPQACAATLHRWSGQSTEAFAAALTRRHIADALERGRGAVAAAAPHAIEMGPAGGRDIVYGIVPSPFGEALLLACNGAIVGLAFRNDDACETSADMLADMTGRWPRSTFRESIHETRGLAEAVFSSDRNAPPSAPRLLLLGSPFEIAVWRALLAIPPGSAVTYGCLAGDLGRRTAARAVGTAVGRNPISYVVPCHRVVRGTGALGGYHWGVTRKRAMIAWEAARAVT